MRTLQQIKAEQWFLTLSEFILLIGFKIGRAIRLKKQKAKLGRIIFAIDFKALNDMRRKDRNQLLKLRNKLNTTTEVLDYFSFSWLPKRCAQSDTMREGYFRQSRCFQSNQELMRENDTE